jgi:hypothetical protein
MPNGATEIGVIGWATCFRHVRREIALYLLSLGARSTILSAIALDRANLLRELIGRDPGLLRMQMGLLRMQIMSRFEYHRTPLHFAVLKNRPAMVKLLLDLGADALAKDSRGYTALNLVTERTNEAIVASLLAAGADPRERNVNRFEHVCVAPRSFLVRLRPVLDA